MIRKMLIVACLAGLAACGGGGESALVDACVEQGDSKKNCACMADKMKEGLSPKAYDAMVAGATGDEQSMETMMQDLSISDAMKISVVMMAVVTDCGVTSFQ